MIYHILPEQEPFSAKRGGALTHTVANLMRLDSTRMVVCLSADDTWGSEKERILVIPRLRAYTRIRGRKYVPLWIMASLLRYIYEPLLSRLQSGDIVWCHNRPVFAAALERTVHAKGARLVYHCHDGINFRAARVAFRSFTPDAYIFVSDYLRKYWMGFFPWFKNTYAIHNGADQSLFYPLTSGAAESNKIPTILYTGRLSPEKGVHVLMEALQILQKRKVEACCNVVGSAFSGGSKATPYVDQLMSYKLPNARFKGFCSATEVAKEFRSADIFCCPSIWQEPFGKVVVEAMACGIPVIASRVGGIPEIAAQGGVILVEPGNADELADALQELIEDRENRLKIASEGLVSFRKQFTWDNILQQYNDVAASIQNAGRNAGEI